MIQGMACKNAHNLHNKKDVPFDLVHHTVFPISPMSDDEHELVGESQEGSKILESGNSSPDEALPSGQGDVEARSSTSKEHIAESPRVDNRDASSRRFVLLLE
ncbi:hypothetical protein MRX96_029839 [Rhipicephalus microplus]